jgi:aminopeptidase N
MGESLQPYFDQWFLRPGHPELRVTHIYDEADNLYHLQVEQVQDTARTGLFDFEVDIELNFYTLEPYQQRVRVNTKDTTFVFAGSSPISFLRFNAGDWLLADVRSEKPVDEWITQLRRDDEVAGRYHAVGALARQEPAKEVRDALTAAATNDAHPLIRARAAEALARYGDDSYAVRVLLERAEDDEASSVRLAALNSLEDTPDSRVLDAVRAILADETASYRVTAAAIGLIAARDSANALSTFEPLYDIDSWRDTVERALVAAIDTLKQPAGLPYLLRQLEAGKPDALVTAALDAAAPMVAEATDLHSELLDRLGHLLSARSEAVRLRTVRVLGALPDPAATDMLEQRQAVESSARVRQAIERILTERQSGKP